MNFKTRFNYKQEDGITFKMPSATFSEFKDECDINRIMARYESTGVLNDPLNLRSSPPTYGDFSNMGDYMEHMNAIIDAQNAFDRLPAKVRARFHNDPSELLQFVNDDGNREEAVKLGLVEAPQIDSVTPTESAVTPTPSNGSST